MPPSVTPPPFILDPFSYIHLYRHILREITYLPPPARPWAVERLRDRFRARPRIKHPLELRRRIYTAHGALWRLRAANHGHADRMRDVLFRAFGRRGKRRRQLLRQLVYPPPKPPADEKELAAAVDKSRGVIIGATGATGATETTEAIGSGSSRPVVAEAERPGQSLPPTLSSTTVAASNTLSELPPPPPAPSTSSSTASTSPTSPTSQSNRERRWNWLDKWDTPFLLQYLSSQKSQEGHVSTPWPSRLQLGLIDPRRSFPELNVWRRPWHPKTFRTKMAKAWRRLADKIQPPLPRGEWDMLRTMSLNEPGADEWKRPQRRRRPAVATDEVEPSDPAEQTLIPPVQKMQHTASSSADVVSEGKSSPQRSQMNKFHSADPTALWEDKPWDWTAYATKPIRLVERPMAPRNVRLSGQTDPGPYGRELRAPRPDGRWLRRLYKAVWHSSSVVESRGGTAVVGAAETDMAGTSTTSAVLANPRQDKSKQDKSKQDKSDGGKPKVTKPLITWGAGKRSAFMATAAHAELFEGVDVKGKSLFQQHAKKGDKRGSR